MEYAFCGAFNMVYAATDVPDLSRVTDMSQMFRGTTAFNGDISSWDVSSVTDMSGMFTDSTAFNGDISSWDVSSVTYMADMFSGASSFNQPLNDWDVSSVDRHCPVMFARRLLLQPAPRYDWDVSRGHLP